MTEIQTLGSESPFDGIRQVDENGELWTGRELQPLMDYRRWREFAVVIEKAKASLALVEGQASAGHHFVEIPKMVAIGSGASREVPDYRLTRFGAYLTAMAGDDTKEAVARARVYFAVRTREAEVGQRAIPGSYPAALRAYADEVEAHQQTKEQRDALIPLAEAYADLMEADGTFDWAAVAQIFARITGGLGRNNFLDLLRSDDVKILKQNRTPYQLKELDRYFKVIPTKGGSKADPTTRVTPEGLDWLRKRLIKHFNHQPGLFTLGEIT